MTLPKVNRQLAVAAVLGWIWAAIMGLLTAVLTIPALSAGRAEAAAMIVPALLCVATAAGSHGIRRLRWPFLALGAASGWIAFLVTTPFSATIRMPGVVLNVVILGLVLTNMRNFRWGRGS